MAFLVGEWVTPDFGINSNNLELKTGVRLIDLAKFLATTGIWVSMSFTVHIFTGCDIQHFIGPGEDKQFYILDQQ